MKTLYLAALEINNFRSFRHVVVDLPTEPGMVFLTGINEVEPDLGANGAGKSSLWEALFWCQYGTTTDGLKAADLATWGSGERPDVTATYIINDETVVLQRTGSPNRLTINDKPVAQHEVDHRIGLAREQFAQAVMFGQRAKLFIDLSPPERSAIFDGVLNLNIWQQAAVNARTHAKATEARMRAKLADLAHAEGELSGIGDPADLHDKIEDYEDERAREIDVIIKQVEVLDDQLAQLARQITGFEADLQQHETTRQDTSELRVQVGKLTNDLAFIESDAARSARDARFFRNNSVCPTCGTSIDKATAQRKVHQCTADLQNLNSELAVLQQQKNAIVVQLAEIDQQELVTRRARDAVITALARAKAEVKNKQEKISELEHQAERADTRVNPYQRMLDELEEKRRAATEKRDVLKKQADALTAQHAAEVFWVQGFREVRQYQIKQALQHLEIEVANAATVLGLSDWSIRFYTEEGERSVTGLFIEVQNPDGYGAKWEAYSGGEGARLRLAVTRGLSNMIQSLVGVDAKWEVWDEPTQWLSSEGIEDLLQCLEYQAELTGRTIWLLDHRALVFGGFSEVWTARKSQNGTVLETA